MSFGLEVFQAGNNIFDGRASHLKVIGTTFINRYAHPSHQSGTPSQNSFVYSSFSSPNTLSSAGRGNVYPCMDRFVCFGRFYRFTPPTGGRSYGNVTYKVLLCEVLNRNVYHKAEDYYHLSYINDIYGAGNSRYGMKIMDSEGDLGFDSRFRYLRLLEPKSAATSGSIPAAPSGYTYMLLNGIDEGLYVYYRQEEDERYPELHFRGITLTPSTYRIGTYHTENFNFSAWQRPVNRISPVVSESAFDDRRYGGDWYMKQSKQPVIWGTFPD